MEREKEIFLEEEREQKLKDRQVFVNLTRDRPKEIVETEIIDKTIPSPDTKRKDEGVFDRVFLVEVEKIIVRFV